MARHLEGFLLLRFQVQKLLLHGCPASVTPGLKQHRLIPHSLWETASLGVTLNPNPTWRISQNSGSILQYAEVLESQGSPGWNNGMTKNTSVCTSYIAAFWGQSLGAIQMWSLGGQFSVWESRKCICCISCPSLVRPFFFSFYFIIK